MEMDNLRFINKLRNKYGVRIIEHVRTFLSSEYFLGSTTMSYDQGYWHSDSCTEKNLDEQYAGTHIAVYVKWCIENDFLANDILETDTDVIASVLEGRMTVSDYFEKYFDWKLGEWNLNKEGNAFTSCYYSHYFEEVSDEVPSVVYGPESNVDFPKLYAMLDDRLRKFKESGDQAFTKPKTKSWWKFW